MSCAMTNSTKTDYEVVKNSYSYAMGKGLFLCTPFPAMYEIYFMIVRIRT